MMNASLCKYEGCNHPVNRPYDDNYCLFHAPKEFKGISVKRFNELIFEKIEKEDFNFEGYVFPGDIHFKKDAQFRGKSIFNSALFLGDTNFTEVLFQKSAFFRKALFAGDVHFRKSTFSGITDFFLTHFSGEADFISVQFLGGTSFISSQFEGGSDFFSAKFTRDVDFYSTQFFNNVNFKGVKFWGNINFSSTKFFKEVYFVENEIKHLMEFNNISFTNDSLFYFQNPKFIIEPGKILLILFQKVQFIPFRTFFENFSVPQSRVNKDFSPAVLFRYCQLKDIYFSNNLMSYFSFYNSSFDEARFISNEWRYGMDRLLFFPVRRRNILFEERLYSFLEKNGNGAKEKFLKLFQIQSLNLKEIEGLYRRIKIAHDRLKNYQESGKFYYNECETKRLSFRLNFRRFPLRKKLRYLFKQQVFNWYKLLSGYGEKPAWTFVWFFLFTLFFSFTHLLSGIRVGEQQIINYDFPRSFEKLSQLFSVHFWSDFLHSLMFTLYRIFPVDYLPAAAKAMTPVGADGLFWAFSNTFVSILLFVLFVCGLRRQFKRF